MKKIILGTVLAATLSTFLHAGDLYEYALGYESSSNPLYEKDKEGINLEFNHLTKCSRRCHTQHSFGFQYSVLESNEDSTLMKDQGNIFSLQYKLINKINHTFRPYIGMSYNFQDVGTVAEDVNEEYSATSKGFGYQGGIKIYFSKSSGMELSVGKKMMSTSNDYKYDVKNKSVKLIYSF